MQTLPQELQEVGHWRWKREFIWNLQIYSEYGNGAEPYIDYYFANKSLVKVYLEFVNSAVKKKDGQIPLTEQDIDTILQTGKHRVMYNSRRFMGLEFSWKSRIFILQKRRLMKDMWFVKTNQEKTE